MPGHQPLNDSVSPRLHARLRIAYRAVVIALFAVIALELLLSTRQESQVVDESAHLFAGFEYWEHADFGRNPEHPPLVKLIAGLSLLPLHLKEPEIPPIPFFKGQDFIGASQFLYSADADSILMRGRMALAVFPLGLALLALAAAYEMFGPGSALCALALLAFEPVLLANGALVTTDMALTCLFFVSVYAFYRYVKQPSQLRLALCALAVAFTVAAKHSGALILPTLALIAVAEMLAERRQAASPGSSSARSLTSKTVTFAAALLAVAVVSYLVLWAFYGFRYSARPTGLQMAPPLAAYSAALKSSGQKFFIEFFARHRLFPEAYLYGWVDILQIPATRPTFIFGKLYSTGQWFFFPAVFLIKSTISLLLLLALVPFAGLWKQRREMLFLVIPPVFFLLIAIFSKLNLGVRHILPIYPFCIVLAGASAWHLAARSRFAAVGIAALLVFAMASSVKAFPNYLAYSNEAFGGPSKTYLVVTDSNADWGQGLKWVKRYLDQQQISDCWFDYMNPFVKPGYYGIRCKPLLSALGRFGLALPTPVPSTISGTILISTTEAEGLLWGPDVLNPYESFKNRRADGLIGNVVLVYRGTFSVPLLAAHSRATLAFALLSQRQVPEAITEARRAVEQAPDSAEINAMLGRILMAAGRTAEAQQSFATALRLANTIHPDYQLPVIHQLLSFP